MSGGKSPITCHVLIASRGIPAHGVRVRLEYQNSENYGWSNLAEGETDKDGRCSYLLPSDRPAQKGVFRIRFETGEYFAKIGEQCFYPYVEIVFELAHPDQHYHIPLLLSPYSYTTYRGS